MRTRTVTARSDSTLRKIARRLHHRYQHYKHAPPERQLIAAFRSGGIQIAVGVIECGFGVAAVGLKIFPLIVFCATVLPRGWPFRSPRLIHFPRFAAQKPRRVTQRDIDAAANGGDEAYRDVPSSSEGRYFGP